MEWKWEKGATCTEPGTYQKECVYRIFALQGDKVVGCVASELTERQVIDLCAAHNRSEVTPAPDYNRTDRLAPEAARTYLPEAVETAERRTL